MHSNLTIHIQIAHSPHKIKKDLNQSCEVRLLLRIRIRDKTKKKSKKKKLKHPRLGIGEKEREKLRNLIMFKVNLAPESQILDLHKINHQITNRAQSVIISRVKRGEEITFRGM